MTTLAEAISHSLSLSPPRVTAALTLFDSGSTVPFVARYRKEQTGGLDEVELRSIMERRDYLSELDQRRAAIVEAIKDQGKLSPELAQQLAACQSKTELEDLYAPYKKRRKTRADKARDRGLEPLAELIRAQRPEGHPQQDARRFVDSEKDVASVDEALAGARDIVAEELALDSNLRSCVP